MIDDNYRDDRAVSNKVHCHRNSKAMPVILQPDDYDRWLSGAAAAAFQAPFPSQLMSVVD
tara:strand:- start:401 stop:580 length:180 start_codon:yes stop_codon:yes gene_type:complete